MSWGLSQAGATSNSPCSFIVMWNMFKCFIKMQLGDAQPEITVFAASLWCGKIRSVETGSVFKSFSVLQTTTTPHFPFHPLAPRPHPPPPPAPLPLTLPASPM